MGDSILVTRNQGKETLQHRLSRKRILVDHLISPDLRKILGFGNVAGVANQGSKESIELLEVHRSLAAKALEHVAQALEIGIGQWLWGHTLATA